MSLYGMTCWNCEGDSPEGPTMEEAERLAHEAGWVIGHRDGQAHYSCPDCASGLFDAMPLWSGYYESPPQQCGGSK